CSPWAATCSAPPVRATVANDHGAGPYRKRGLRRAPGWSSTITDDGCARNLLRQGFSGLREPAAATTTTRSYSGRGHRRTRRRDHELGEAMQLHWGVSARRAFAVNVVA